MAKKLIVISDDVVRKISTDKKIPEPIDQSIRDLQEMFKLEFAKSVAKGYFDNKKQQESEMDFIFRNVMSKKDDGVDLQVKKSPSSPGKFQKQLSRTDFEAFYQRLFTETIISLNKDVANNKNTVDLTKPFGIDVANGTSGLSLTEYTVDPKDIIYDDNYSSDAKNFNTAAAQYGLLKKSIDNTWEENDSKEIQKQQKIDMEKFEKDSEKSKDVKGGDVQGLKEKFEKKEAKIEDKKPVKKVVFKKQEEEMKPEEKKSEKKSKVTGDIIKGASKNENQFQKELGEGKTGIEKGNTGRLIKIYQQQIDQQIKPGNKGGEVIKKKGESVPTIEEGDGDAPVVIPPKPTDDDKTGKEFSFAKRSYDATLKLKSRPNLEVDLKFEDYIQKTEDRINKLSINKNNFDVNAVPQKNDRYKDAIESGMLKDLRENRLLAYENVTLHPPVKGGSHYEIKEPNKDGVLTTAISIHKNEAGKTKVVFDGGVNEKNLARSLDVITQTKNKLLIGGCGTDPETAAKMAAGCLLYGNKFDFKQDGTAKAVTDSEFNNFYLKYKDKDPKTLTSDEMAELNDIIRNPQKAAEVKKIESDNQIGIDNLENKPKKNNPDHHP